MPRFIMTLIFLLLISSYSVAYVYSSSECNDGLDNDGDGLIDWQYDVGCSGEGDTTETSGSLAEEDGWTTFDLSADSLVFYVSSSDGDDNNNGLTPETAVSTISKGFSLLRDGYPDFLLLKRGDTWRIESWSSIDYRFKSGRSATEPIVISTYGESEERPFIQMNDFLIDDDGRSRNYIAVLGLHLQSYTKEPTDPDFTGHSSTGFRFVGERSQNLLFEDNFLEYGEFVFQGVDDSVVRRNVVYRHYDVDTCLYNSDGSRNLNGDPAYRPSGTFVGSDSDGILFEENIYDENGWNPDVPPPLSCATIYNHNFYISGSDNITLRENIITRGSSIGVKFSSGGLADSVGTVVENNLIAEGEIGISIGGNADTEYRFKDVQIRDNVFTDIGRTPPTTRSLAWYVDVIDNDNAIFESNLMVNPPPRSNVFGFSLSGGSNRQVTLCNNLLHGFIRSALKVYSDDGDWSAILIKSNTLFTPNGGENPIVYHRGDFSTVTYAGNDYYTDYASTNQNADGWFDNVYPFLSIEEWRIRSGEGDAMVSDYVAPDAGRNIDSYAAHLGLGVTLDDFMAEARQQSRFNYRPELTATAVNTYIREGYITSTTAPSDFILYLPFISATPDFNAELCSE